MIDLSNVVDVPIEEIKPGDEILVKYKVEYVYLNTISVTVNCDKKYAHVISRDEYLCKIEQPPKVGDRYKHEHGQPIRVIFIVRDYAVVEYEQAELVPLICTFGYLKRLEKLPEREC